MSNRTSRYKEVLAAAAAPMTIREICEKAQIPANEAKFVSSGLDREVKNGRAEKSGQVVCPVTQRKSLAYRLLPSAPKAAKAPKATKPDPAPSDPSASMPDPVMSPRVGKSKRKVS